VKVNNEKTENSQVFLTIEMEQSEMEESLESSYKSLVKTAKIPGFRKGKAPRAVLERYVGKESLLENAVNNLVPEAYEKALKEQGIEAIAQPQLEITQTEPLIFKAVVPLKPVIKLGDYRKIRVTPETVEVTENQIDDIIEELRHQQATWEPVERPVDFGDLAVLNVESSVDQEPFINQQGAQYQLIRDQVAPVAGFAEQLTGMKKGEEKEFQLQLSEDYPKSELAGKEAGFKVQISEIKQEILPELNDQFAQMVSADFKTLNALREQASTDMKKRAEEREKADFEEKIVDAVVDLSQLEYPPVLVEAEINRMLNQRFQGGNQELEEYLSNIGKTEEELREELRPLADKRVSRSLALGKIVEEEKIEVSGDEIDTEIENMTQNATENKDELTRIFNMPQARESLEQTLLSRKTIQHLSEIAEGIEETKVQEEEEK